MSKQKDYLNALEQLLNKIQLDTKRAKMILDQIIQVENGELQEVDQTLFAEGNDLVNTHFNLESDDSVQVIEGKFDGYFMMGSDDKKYPVPLNYSSKTKLIPGDMLKLRIMGDGKLVYKLIGPAPRKFVKATLSKTDDGKYIAVSDDGEAYMLNQASVSFFKGNVGDELSVIVNSEGIGGYAAIEALISRN